MIEVPLYMCGCVERLALSLGDTVGRWRTPIYLTYKKTHPPRNLPWAYA